MTKPTQAIAVDPTSDLGRALADSDEIAVVLVQGETRYRVVPEQADPWADYDPERLRASLRRVAGLFTAEEGDRIIASIYRARDEGTRPIDNG